MHRGFLLIALAGALVTGICWRAAANPSPAVANCLRPDTALFVHGDISGGEALYPTAAVGSSWHRFQVRAQNEFVLNRRRAALADVRTALVVFRKCNREAVPTAVRSRARVEFRDICDEVINEDMAATPALALDAFQVSEESRADLMNSPGERTTPQETLRDIQRNLRANEAYLSFHPGPRSSWLWELTASAFASHRLPPEGELAGLIRRWTAAVQNSTPDRDQLGRRLYRVLFGDLSAAAAKRTQWVIACDGQLFDMPFPALVVNSSGTAVFLVERHATRRIPGALAAPAATGNRGHSDVFLGIGDGVYNSADERLRPVPVMMMIARRISAPDIDELPRLPATGVELRSAASAWNRSLLLLLTGAQATRRNLLAALACRPAVVHLATHVLHRSARADDALLDFGRDRRGAAESLTTAEISVQNVPETTVVMSGCASGTGDSSLSTGLGGLTGAWIMAGARAVVGSRWTTSDDNGALFASFYRHFAHTRLDGARGAAGRALQLARLDMLHSHSWRSEPAYWAAFRLLEKE